MILPPKMMTTMGTQDKSRALLLIVMVNLVLLFLLVVAEYRYRKALEKNEKIIQVYFSRYLHYVKLRAEDFLPVSCT